MLREGEFDSLTPTNSSAHGFGLMDEVCDLYWADVTGAQNRSTQRVKPRS